jgi:hypothetical protein
MAEPDAAAVGARVERLLDELAASADPVVVERVRELAQRLVELYGAGLARVLEVCRRDDAGGDGGVVDRLGRDPLVGRLLLIHGLHPLPVEARIAGAVKRVRALAALRGVTVALAAAPEGAVCARLAAVSHACAGALDEIEHALRHALADEAPEVARVEIERDAPAPVLLQIARGPARPAAAGGR